VIERTPSPTPASLHFSQPAKNKSATFNGRCIIIINPFTYGCGDKYLAIKLSRIIHLQNIKVTIININTFMLDDESNKVADILEFYNDIISKNDATLASIAQTNNKVAFVVAPADLLSLAQAELLINLIQTTYNYNKTTPLFINEMGILMDAPDETIQHTLGFEEDEIGYLPLSKEAITQIEQTHRAHTSNLIDSFQLSFNPDHLYFVGYLSSFINPRINAFFVDIFIDNTQTEYAPDNNVSHYLMSYTDFTMDIITELDKKFTEVMLQYKLNLYHYNENKLTLINSYNTDRQYKPVVNIYCGGMIPQDIFFSFIRVATDGIMTGDHSLSEYISIKKSFPHYQQQPFKAAMVESILYKAKQIGGKPLTEYLSTKILGFNGENAPMEFNILKNDLLDEINETDVKQKFEQALVAKNAEPVLIDLFNNLVASV
jgi:hypothetical protein